MTYHHRDRAGKLVPVDLAVIHCAAVPRGFFAYKTALQVWSIINRWHLEGARGRPPFKNGFGYHGLVMPDGEFMAGRPYSMTGAHVVGHNVGSLGFLLIETAKIDRMGEFADWFTDAQRDSLRAVIGSIPGIRRVAGHNDFAPKLCPGFKVQSEDWLDAVPASRPRQGAGAAQQ